MIKKVICGRIATVLVMLLSFTFSSVSNELPLVSLKIVEEDQLIWDPFQMYYVSTAESKKATFYSYSQNLELYKSMEAYQWPSLIKDNLRGLLKICCEDDGEPLKDYIMHRDFILAPKKQLKLQKSSDWVTMKPITKPGIVELVGNEGADIGVYREGKWFKFKSPALLLILPQDTLRIVVNSKGYKPEYLEIYDVEQSRIVPLQLEKLSTKCDESLKLPSNNFDENASIMQLQEGLDHIDYLLVQAEFIRKTNKQYYDSIYSFPQHSKKDGTWFAYIKNLKETAFSLNSCDAKYQRDIQLFKDRKQAINTLYNVISYKVKEVSRLDSITSIAIAVRYTLFSNAVFSVRTNLGMNLPSDHYLVQPSYVRGIDAGLSYCVQVAEIACISPVLGFDYSVWNYDASSVRSSYSMESRFGASFKIPLLFRPGSYLGSLLIGGVELFGAYNQSKVNKENSLRDDLKVVSAGFGVSAELFHFRFPVGVELAYQYNYQGFGRIFMGANYTLRGKK